MQGCRAAHRVERPVHQEGTPVRGHLRHRQGRRVLRAQLPRHQLVSGLRRRKNAHQGFGGGRSLWFRSPGNGSGTRGKADGRERFCWPTCSDRLVDYALLIGDTTAMHASASARLHLFFLVSLFFSSSLPLPKTPLEFCLSGPSPFYCFFFFSLRPENEDWVLTTTTYGGGPEDPSEHFISSVQKGNVTACQFHPEKSGKVRGLLANADLRACSGDWGPINGWMGLCYADEIWGEGRSGYMPRQRSHLKLRGGGGESIGCFDSLRWTRLEIGESNLGSASYRRSLFLCVGAWLANCTQGSHFPWCFAIAHRWVSSFWGHFWIRLEALKTAKADLRAEGAGSATATSTPSWLRGSWRA